MRKPWRRCGSCGGVCHWHDTDWVCRDCGDEWNEEFDPKYAAPGDARPIPPACTCNAGDDAEFPAQHATLCPRFAHPRVFPPEGGQS